MIPKDALQPLTRKSHSDYVWLNICTHTPVKECVVIQRFPGPVNYSYIDHAHSILNPFPFNVYEDQLHSMA